MSPKLPPKLLPLLLALLAIGLAPPALAGEDTEPVVVLETTQGDITLRFFPGAAPEHVKNFLWHAEHTYPGCTFHRVVPGFMIQGGDPLSKDDDPGNDGRGGHSYEGEGKLLKAEFNGRPHLRGALSMARERAPDTAGSQFFICQGEPRFLDGKYTVFGETIDGIEVVDAIAAVPRNRRDRPETDQRILAARIEQWPTEKVEATKAAMQAEDAKRRN